ncbi:hypothetical protein OJ997_16665 [Solirubrobacter phytolaccae]|uniref:Uncharacterized protein n=1 Tax=Solirubrobacter phytolaccae TaxID=1404360 RepID=A0A9X3S8U6_9ACTN|nr:hypothetical protein [Solirubrobacter phytolaccae]MDA0181938.1 hypothetical protein [Solirubrobacter phytolaccae]
MTPRPRAAQGRDMTPRPRTARDLAAPCPRATHDLAAAGLAARPHS